MKALIKILEEFDVERTKKRNEGVWNEDAVAECFKSCAKKILCNGYFLINGEYIIDLGAIELYYHEEEEGGIKDYIMYHSNAHPSKSKVYKLNNSYPYFKFGSFNLHQSGVDVTFENEEKEYRASFLIRSYRVLKTEDGLYPENDNTEYDTHSTHIFDDMFYSGYGNTEIVWIPTDKKIGDVIQSPRVHVSEKYIKNDNGNYEKEEVVVSDPDFKAEIEDAKKTNRTPIYFKSGSKTYKQDMREWQFEFKLKK
jgi:hypothetical protein